MLIKRQIYFLIAVKKGVVTKGREMASSLTHIATFPLESFLLPGQESLLRCISSAGTLASDAMETQTPVIQFCNRLL
jgi:hypothetical protein